MPVLVLRYNRDMTLEQLQDLCEAGQRELMATNYLAAEKILVEAERIALDQNEFETLARLYMPLQEARRQRRQRCGEGIIRLDLIAQGPHDHITGREVLENHSFGQLLVAGWGTIAPALELRRLQAELDLYVETFLAAVFSTSNGTVVAIVAEESHLPPPEPQPLESLKKNLPPNTLLYRPNELPQGAQRGTHETYSRVMQMWERLHSPFLAAADAQKDPLQKIHDYRRTIRVDYACELAHQKLAATAQRLAATPAIR
jgi:hypothetical protein